MKRVVILIVLAVLILVAAGVWYFSASEDLKPTDLLEAGIIIVLTGFALFAGYKRLTSVRHGEPADDEMSRKIMRKASSLSYYISIYLWLAIMYFSDKLEYETHTIIGAGILGMAVIFCLCWIVFKVNGVRND